MHGYGNSAYGAYSYGSCYYSNREWRYSYGVYIYGNRSISNGCYYAYSSEYRRRVLVCDDY